MAKTKTLDVGGAVKGVRWDWSGQYLAAVGPSGVSVQCYRKGERSWSEVVRSGVGAVAAAWGDRGERVVVVGADGEVTVLGASEE